MEVEDKPEGFQVGNNGGAVPNFIKWAVSYTDRSCRITWASKYASHAKHQTDRSLQKVKKKEEKFHNNDNNDDLKSELAPLKSKDEGEEDDDCADDKNQY